MLKLLTRVLNRNDMKTKRLLRFEKQNQKLFRTNRCLTDEWQLHMQDLNITC